MYRPVGKSNRWVFRPFRYMPAIMRIAQSTVNIRAVSPDAATLY
jgi:hypothetical protein